MKRLSVYISLLLLFSLTSCSDPRPIQAIYEEDDETSIVEEDITLAKTIDGTIKNGDIIEGHYIVVLKETDTPYEMVETILKSHGLSLPDVVYHVYQHAIKGFAARIPDAKIEALKNNPNVAYVEPDRYITINVKPDKLPFEEDPVKEDQITPWGITMVGIGTPIDNARAWIIDTGVDFDNEDLNVNKTLSKTFVRSKSADDDNGHGSHVAGTIGARDNDFGVVGVAPSVEIVAVKVLDKRGSGSYSGVIAGIDYVANNGSTGDVANMSLGGPASIALDTAVINAGKAGIKMVVAAGNDTKNASLYSPARAEGKNVYTVSAMDANSVFASFSNYGIPPVDYCEPGVNVLSFNKDGNIVAYNGTSMATPHLAGILLTTEDVRVDEYVNRGTDDYPIGIVNK